MPTRVALLHYTCPPVVGGVEGLLRIHARLFVEHGYAVEVFTGRGRQFDHRVPVHRWPELDSKHPEVVAVTAELARGEVSPRFAALRDRLLAWWNDALAPFDAAIVHNAFTLHFNIPLTAALHRAADAPGPRLVAWCHDLSWSNPLYRAGMREADPWALLKTCHPAVRYVVVSRDRQRDLAALAGVSPERLAVVPAGVDLGRWLRLGAATRRLLAALHLAPEELVLLLPARITRRKNVELAIRIVAVLRDQGARPRLLVTGPPGPHDVRAGTYLHELLTLRAALGVEAEVELLYPHRLSDATMADLYQVADALLFPSSQEGFGIPLLEAGLSRLPVFCSDLPPFHEIAGDRVHYFAVDENPAEVARRLLDFVATDPVARLRRHVRQEYSWDVLFARLIAPLVQENDQPSAPD
jgi:glycosyltransferase involved in cell wall biosynthesis